MISYFLSATNRKHVLNEIGRLEGAWRIICRKLPNRSAEQNRKLFACLEDIAAQVVWHGQKYDKYDWKDILTSGVRKQRLAPGIDGWLVSLGDHTSEMSVEEMTELLEFVLWFGVEKGVRWSDQKETA